MTDPSIPSYILQSKISWLHIAVCLDISPVLPVRNKDLHTFGRPCSTISVIFQNQQSYINPLYTMIGHLCGCEEGAMV